MINTTQHITNHNDIINMQKQITQTQPHTHQASNNTTQICKHKHTHTNNDTIITPTNKQTHIKQRPTQTHTDDTKNKYK